MTNKFDGNIRTTGILTDEELRASLKGGWDKELPAIKDENEVFIVGHRRLKIAKEEGITPVIKMVMFGDGPEADAARVRLANVSNIGGAPMTREDRQCQAERLYKGGVTMEAIAHMLGVSKATICGDLALFSVEQRQPKIDTLGRKNTGRPKGAGKPKKPPQIRAKHEKIVDLADQGLPPKKIAEEIGIGERMVDRVLEVENARREGMANPPIDPSTLSKTAQEKLASALRQQKHGQEQVFEQRVLTEIAKRLDHLVLPAWREKIKRAETLYANRKGVMSKAVFNKIRFCLHPDTRLSRSEAEINEAANIWEGLEEKLLSEKESPTTFDWPTTDAEWEARKQEAAMTRKAKRGNSNVNTRH